MSELNGIHSRRRKKSFAMECASRWLLEIGKPCSADNIYSNMTFMNGRLYNSTRYSITRPELLARMIRMPKLFNIHRDDSVLMFSCTQENYDYYFHDYRSQKK